MAAQSIAILGPILIPVRFDLVINPYMDQPAVLCPLNT